MTEKELNKLRNEIKDGFKLHMLITEKGPSIKADDVNELVECIVNTMENDFNVAGIILNAAYLYGMKTAIERKKVNMLADEAFEKIRSANGIN